MKSRGLYFAWSLGEVFGLSAAVIWMPDEQDFQIAIMVGWLTLAVGYSC